MASDLRPAELFKYPWRVEAFLTKYKTKSPFQLTASSGGGKITLLPQKQVMDVIQKQDARAASKLLLVSADKPPRAIKLQDLQKTAEFGGRGGGGSSGGMTGEAVHGLLHRMHHLDATYPLHAPAASERGELMVLQDINGYILSQEGPIDVKVGNITVKNVYGANKVEGTPKADIALVTYNTRLKKFQDSYFISHKLGNDAASFQQYSGVTTKADGSRSGSISQDKTVLKFLKKLTTVYDRIVKKKERFYMPITDEKLLGKAVYGPEFGSAQYTIDNIHMIAQGNPILREQGKVHALSFSGPGTTFAPSVNHFKSGSYQAVLGARFSSGRGFEVDGKRYDNIRVLIIPQVVLGSKAQNILSLDK